MTISNTVFYFLWLLEHNRVGTPTAARGHYALIEAAGNSYENLLLVEGDD